MILYRVFNGIFVDKNEDTFEFVIAAAKDKEEAIKLAKLSFMKKYPNELERCSSLVAKKLFDLDEKLTSEVTQ